MHSDTDLIESICTSYDRRIAALKQEITRLQGEVECARSTHQGQVCNTMGFMDDANRLKQTLDTIFSLCSSNATTVTLDGGYETGWADCADTIAELIEQNGLAEQLKNVG